MVSLNTFGHDEFSSFEFGKGFTSTGTGVGLYHIKDITVNKLNGSVSILSEPDSGFTLQIRIRG